MKIIKFLSCAFLLCMLSFLTITNVSAATASISFGKPIDALTGEEVENFKPNQLIEVPVEVNADEGHIASLDFDIYADDQIFIAGVYAPESGAAPDADEYYGTYSNSLVFSYLAYTDYVVTRNCMGTARNRGQCNGRLFPDDNRITMAWTSTGISPVNLNASGPEFYIPFTVRSDYDEAALSLNYTGTNNHDENGMFYAESTSIKVNAGDPAIQSSVNSDEKLNACDGAFAIKIDSSKLGKWVQGIKIGEKDIVNYTTDDDTVYIFPVRVNKPEGYAEDSANLNVVITVTDDENGAVNSQEITVPVTISDLTGTVKNYGDGNDVSASIK